MAVPFDELVVLLLPNPRYEALALELRAQTECGEAVLGEAEVEERGDVDVGGCELFLLLDQVRAADEPDCNLVAELREQLEHLGLDQLQHVSGPCVSDKHIDLITDLTRLGECVVDIEEEDGVLDRALVESRVY